ncbi:transposase [Persephonella sp.]
MSEKKEIICPDCGATECIKNGKANGKQTYLCKNCLTRFTLNRIRNRYPKSIKKQAVLLRKQGYKLAEISKELNVKIQTIHYWLKKYA